MRWALLFVAGAAMAGAGEDSSSHALECGGTAAMLAAVWVPLWSYR